LAAQLCPDLLGKLTALLQTPWLDIGGDPGKGKKWREVKGRGWARLGRDKVRQRLCSSKNSFTNTIRYK